MSYQIILNGHKYSKLFTNERDVRETEKALKSIFIDLDFEVIRLRHCNRSKELLNDGEAYQDEEYETDFFSTTHPYIEWNDDEEAYIMVDDFTKEIYRYKLVWIEKNGDVVEDEK